MLETKPGRVTALRVVGSATFGHQGTIACPIASNDLDQPLDEPTANWLELGTEPRGRWCCVTASTHWRASVP
jgi:hypothetical protein